MILNLRSTALFETTQEHGIEKDIYCTFFLLLMQRVTRKMSMIAKNITLPLAIMFLLPIL